MKHLFASGEHIYNKNEKDLEQGKFVAEYLEYDEMSEDTMFEAIGSIDGKPASAKFKISKDSFGDIKFKHTVRILMQSDIFQSDWDGCEITYL